MSGSDIVFAAATGVALIAASAVYLFAWSIQRNREALPTSAPAAAGEEASNPFPEKTAVATQSMRESMIAIVRAARKKGAAVDIHIPDTGPLSQKVIFPERERA